MVCYVTPTSKNATTLPCCIFQYPNSYNLCIISYVTTRQSGIGWAYRSRWRQRNTRSACTLSEACYSSSFLYSKALACSSSCGKPSVFPKNTHKPIETSNKLDIQLLCLLRTTQTSSLMDIQIHEQIVEVICHIKPVQLQLEQFKVFWVTWRYGQVNWYALIKVNRYEQNIFTEILDFQLSSPLPIECFCKNYVQ